MGSTSPVDFTAKDSSYWNESSPKSRLPRVTALKIHLANLGQERSREQVISAVPLDYSSKVV